MNKILFALIALAMPFVNSAQSKRGKVWVTGGVEFQIKSGQKILVI